MKDIAGGSEVWLQIAMRRLRVERGGLGGRAEVAAEAEEKAAAEAAEEAEAE